MHASLFNWIPISVQMSQKSKKKLQSKSYENKERCYQNFICWNFHVRSCSCQRSIFPHKSCLLYSQNPFFGHNCFNPHSPRGRRPFRIRVQYRCKHLFWIWVMSKEENSLPESTTQVYQQVRQCEEHIKFISSVCSPNLDETLLQYIAIFLVILPSMQIKSTNQRIENILSVSFVMQS